MTQPDDTGPTKTWCARCIAKNHLACLWRSRPGGCGCPCPWLVADMASNFPSLRRQLIEGEP
jgi:hypothetical protein